MSFYSFYICENTQGEYKYSSVQFDLPKDIAEKVLNFSSNISDEDIYVDENDPSYGREDNIRVTILYGIHDENSENVEPVICSTKPFKIKLGNISFFESDKYDVMKIDIHSDELHDLHNKIKKNVKNTQSFDEYHPHCTIAYVNKNYDRSNIDKEQFKDIETEISNVIFSSYNKEDVGKKLISM